MLNRSDQQKLQKLIASLPLSDAFNIQTLQGYLYAVVITPEVIAPSEWMPNIFGGDMPEYDNVQQAESTVSALMDGYNHYNALRLENRLSFPFEIDQLTPEMFDEIIDWSFGFYQGLRLRMNIWLSRVVTRDLGEEEDPVANSVGIISALIHDDDDDNYQVILDNTKDSITDNIDEEEVKVRMVATLIRILPESVKIIQEFAEALDEQNLAKMHKQRQTPSEKIGRNQPCPCGSGKKYKKCCGMKDNLIAVH